jgi:predicted nucleic acid-binding protein
VKVYLDTMLWVFYFEGHLPFGPPTRKFVDRLTLSNAELVASPLSLAELLVLPKRTGNAFAAAQYRSFFRSQAVSLRNFDLATAERFGNIRAFARVKPADTFHLAIAAEAGTEFFVTGDTALHALTVPGIGSIVPPERVPLP